MTEQWTPGNSELDAIASREQVEVHDARGVDRTLIRAALRRSPTECLELLEELHELLESARRVDQPIR